MKNFIKLHNSIFDYSLSSSSLMVYVALKRHCNIFNHCTVKHFTLAELTGLSVNTVGRAIDELYSKGLVHCKVRYNSSGYRISNSYTLTQLNGSYTKLPRNIFSHNLPKSVFKVFTYLMICKDNKNDISAPSLNRMATTLHMSKRTIVDAVAFLNANILISKENYVRKSDNRQGNNRHFIISTKLRYTIFSIVSKLIRCPSSLIKKMRANLSNRLTLGKNSINILHEIIYNVSPFAIKSKHNLHRYAFHRLI